MDAAVVTPADVQSAVEEHFTRIHRAALVLTGNPWDADDLAQETFMVLTRQGTAFGGRSSLYTWLYGILLNLERRERRRAGVRQRKLQTLRDAGAHRGCDTPTANSTVEAAEWKASLWSVVARLPDAQRQTLVLRFSERLSYEEVAVVMGCPLGTVKSRIFHGLETLRRMLAAAAEEMRIVPSHPAEDCTHVV